MKIKFKLGLLALKLLLPCVLFAQSLNLKMDQVTVKQAINQLKELSDYSFVYVANDLDTGKIISVDARDIRTAVQQILAGQEVAYEIQGKSIVVFKNSSSVSNRGSAQGRTLRGVVRDGQGDPLPGVSILRNGNGVSGGTVTDINGYYELPALPGETLTYSFLGMKPQTVRLSSQSMLDIVLEEESNYLDDVVVIGYGTARKRDMTGAVSNIKAERIVETAPQTVSDILRANAAGLNVSITNSAKGEAFFSIRGDGSLSASNAPLIVLDGVIYDGAFADINPMDIVSVDVLKDASAAAVYGARSANGVIAITTKRGKMGKPVVTLDAKWGMVQAANVPPLLSPEQFLEWRQDYEEGRFTAEYLAKYPQMFVNPNKLTGGLSQLEWFNYDQKVPASSVTDEQLTRQWLSRLDFTDIEIRNYLAGKTTNWNDLVFQNAFQQDYTVGVSAGTDRVQQYYSVNFADRGGFIYGDRYKNIRVRANLETKVTSWLKVGANVQFASRDESPVSCVWTEARKCTPYSTNLIDDPDASETYRYMPNGRDTKNPLYEMKHTDQRNIYQTLNANLFAKVQLPFGIEYEMDYTPYIMWHELYVHHSSKSANYSGRGGQSNRNFDKTFNWRVDNILRWNKTFDDKHRVEVTLLANAEKGQTWASNSQASSYSPNDLLGYHAMGFATVASVSSDDTYQTGDALMARLFYSYNDTYMITASVRRDGYSAFGRHNPHAVFPAVALGWVFTHEPFMEGAQNWFNYGKLRLSWGQNGNREIGRYAALSQMSYGPRVYLDETGTAYKTTWMESSTMANHELRWERTSSLNAGLDFSLFGDTLSGSAEYYEANTYDLLVNRKLPIITGFQVVKANMGQVHNRGFEFTLNTRILNRGDWRWDLTWILSMNRRKIVHLYGDMEDVLDDKGNVIGQKEADDLSSGTFGWFIGQDPDRIWAYERVGVWQSDEIDEAAIYGCQPGDFKYKDQNDDKLMTNKDRIFQGYTTPRARASLNSVLSWKGISLSASCYALLGHYGEFNAAANNNAFPDRSSDYYFPRWTQTNPINDYARIGSKNIGHNFVNKSFIRLNNITLSYNVPNSFCSRMHMQALRMSATVSNAFFATLAPAWNLWDPEMNSPTPRTFTFGINVTL